MKLEFYSYRTSKKKLLQRVKPMSRAAFSNLINPIIMEHRNITIEESKQKQFLQSNEVEYFLNKIGEPLNEYHSLIRIDTIQMNKGRFKLTFSPISDPEFAKIANRIISQERNLDIQKSGRQRYLFPKEVVKLLDEIGELWREPIIV